MNARARLLFVLTGPAGVGKTSLVNGLRERMSNLYFCTTATTRQPRTGEVHGVDYFFYPEERFLSLVAEGAFLEYARVPPPDGSLYGTPREQVEEAFARGQDVFLQVDVQGARSIRALVPETVTLFLRSPDMETLRRRLEARDTETAIEQEGRLRNAEVEMGYEGEFDYSVVNRDGALEHTLDEVSQIIENERRKQEGGVGHPA